MSSNRLRYFVLLNTAFHFQLQLLLAGLQHLCGLIKVIVIASVCCLLIACLVSLIAAVGIRFSLARLHGLGKFFLLVLVG